MASEDQVYAKMILPSTERSGEIVSADDLDGPRTELESHMATQIMKAVATLCSINSNKRVKGDYGGDGRN